MIPRDVSVIIPALNEAERIEAAIESVWQAGAGEIIVCDGGSDDATVKIAQQHRATVVHSPPGRGRQLAKGAEQASGDLLLFLHADNRLGEGCLEQLCRCAPQTATVSLFWGGFRQQIDSQSFMYRILECGNAARIRFRGMPFGDQAMFVMRGLYDQVGGFPTTALMEDVLLSQALRRRCWPTLINRVIHVDSRRWQQRGVIRQTIRNWGIQLAHSFGVSEDRLAKWYR